MIVLTFPGRMKKRGVGGLSRRQRRMTVSRRRRRSRARPQSRGRVSFWWRPSRLQALTSRGTGGAEDEHIKNKKRIIISMYYDFVFVHYLWFTFVRIPGSALFTSMTMLVSPGPGLSYITATARVTERRSHQSTLDTGSRWKLVERRIPNIWEIRKLKKVGVSLRGCLTHLWLSNFKLDYTMWLSDSKSRFPNCRGEECDNCDMMRPRWAGPDIGEGH